MNKALLLISLVLLGAMPVFGYVPSYYPGYVDQDVHPYQRNVNLVHNIDRQFTRLHHHQLRTVYHHQYQFRDHHRDIHTFSNQDVHLYYPPAYGGAYGSYGYYPSRAWG